MTENIEYRCGANCVYNGYSGTGYSPCHLKNKGLKKNKDTQICYGGPCGFYKKLEKEK